MPGTGFRPNAQRSNHGENTMKFATHARDSRGDTRSVARARPIRFRDRLRSHAVGPCHPTDRAGQPVYTTTVQTGTTTPSPPTTSLSEMALASADALHRSYSNLVATVDGAEPGRQHLWQFAAMDEFRSTRATARATAYQTGLYPRTGQITGYGTLSTLGPAGDRRAGRHRRSRQCRRRQQHADHRHDPRELRAAGGRHQRA